MRILIADDHAVLRLGLKEILADEFKKAEFGEADTAHEAIVHVRGEKWDLVVLDITMPGPGQNSLEVLTEIKAIDPKLPVLVLSGHPEGDLAVRFLKAGASGYVTKTRTPAELITAVRKIIAGGRYVSPELAEKIAGHLGLDTEKLPHERLSNREAEVLRLIGSGKSVGKIAVELSLSPKTVSTYRARILQKMGLADSAELMHYAISNKLVEPM